MASIQTINSTDVIANSRADINQNFANLNSDKIETSYLDTDTTLSANSDSKIATQKAVKAYADAVSGSVPASTTVKGSTQEATAVQIDAYTQTGSTGAELFINPKLLSDAHNIPTVVPSTAGNLMTSNGTDWVSSAPTSTAQFVGTGSSSNTTYNNFQISFISGNGWNSIGSPTYGNLSLITGSALGARFDLVDTLTGAVMSFSNQKIKILEWDALIAADVSTGTSVMGFVDSGVTSAAGVAGIESSNIRAVAFMTNASGNWFIYTGNGSSITQTSITNPSVGKHTFRIEYNPATPTATFYIDGVSVGTITTTYPTANNIDVTFSNGTSSTIITMVTAPNYSIAK